MIDALLVVVVKVMLDFTSIISILSIFLVFFLRYFLKDRADAMFNERENSMDKNEDLNSNEMNKCNEINEYREHELKSAIPFFGKVLVLALMVLAAFLAVNGILSQVLVNTDGENDNVELGNTKKAEQRDPAPSNHNAYESAEPAESKRPSKFKVVRSKKFSNGSQEIIHFHYAEADKSKLVVASAFELTKDQRVDYLHKDAERALVQMIAVANAEGVLLVPLSGFRTYEKQSELFDKAVQRHGSEFAAAYLSAPPGYSEHHTGFAVDIGDKKAMEFNLKYEFENTEAYKWLISNADRFSFELSFPKENSQGVSFEPWHWRFIGTQEAFEVFQSAKNL